MKLRTDTVQIQKKINRLITNNTLLVGILSLLFSLNFYIPNVSSSSSHPIPKRDATHTAPPCRPTPSCCDGSCVDATWAFDRLRGTKRWHPDGVGLFGYSPEKVGRSKDLGVVLFKFALKNMHIFWRVWWWWHCFSFQCLKKKKFEGCVSKTFIQHDIGRSSHHFTSVSP